ncbi:penicillin-binding transpeptidase domain-containing protein [Alkalihalobacillus trypoxylicola]|uniref:serine-type D-Ala-D-Ala carboxypeptidase n=1 Tax=Alkalihalobacillus trypoxylicola TaxID=519424 RepID=A0A162FAV4_9BACI|nr:penicillin-binding transpeptidase domain-containing protein [Alkalihalobacillus trypoxylicola]KYG35180.1 penicillin-binding protein [Alkalihalobacillus trypoxylicola]
MEIKRANTNIRAIVLMVIFFIIFAVFIGRILHIQVTKEVRGHELDQIAEERWTKKIPLEGVRGTIFDRSGGAIAEEVKSYKVFAILNRDQSSYVKEPEETAEKLAPYIDQEVGNLARLLSQDKFQVELGTGARNLSYEQMLEIKELDLDGIFFMTEPRRYYPKQMFASHVIGYTERNMEEARMGLERSLDEYLSAKDGSITYLSDTNRAPLLNPNELIEPVENGNHVYLTLDGNIQTSLEQVMTEVDEEYEPERMIAIVADPKTGQILAMSNRPSFNPNEYEKITNYMNFSISDHFEPGSTMKMFTVAAAMEEGVFPANEAYQSGSWDIGPDQVRDHNNGVGWGSISFTEGFLRSSNVAMAKLTIERLGTEKLYDYWERFGFNEPTGIDLPNEANSLIAKGSQFDAVATSFGQGTAVTPIQQIQAATSIANGGKMMKPYIIDRIVDSETNEVMYQNEPEIVGEPISEETSKEMLDLLEGVVNERAGTGNPYYIEGFQVVGKTGTAQIPNPNGGGYIHGHGENIFSFLGMAPKDDPSVLVYVAVERPKLKDIETGSEPTRKIFTTIMKQSLQYLKITPSVEEIAKETVEGYKLNDFTSMSIAEAKEELEEEGLEVVVLGDGKSIISQQPASGKGLLPGEKVFIVTEAEQYEMPEVIGWSTRDVLRLSDALEITPNLFGNGYVTAQNVAPGDVVRPGDYIVIELANHQMEEQQDDEDEEQEENEEEELEEEVGIDS